MTEQNENQNPESPAILGVTLEEGSQIAIMVNPVPMMEAHGTDPGLWADVLASIIESICESHAQALVDGDGNHPSVEDIRHRLMECLPMAMEGTEEAEPG